MTNNTQYNTYLKRWLLALPIGFLAACSDSNSYGNGSSDGPVFDDGYGDETPTSEVFQQTEQPTNVPSAIGEVFVTAGGRTLYTFENDRNDAQGDGVGDSDCNDSCAENWPPLLATEQAQASGRFGIVTRDDGNAQQWTLDGLPLYLFSGDEAQGDTTGEGLGGTWYVARPLSWQQSNVDDSALGTVFAGAFSVLSTDGSGGRSESRIDRNGYTLYTFENDRSEGEPTSNCNAACAEAWPPLYADAGATPSGDFSVVTRDDGTRQWALLGMPLYFFANDSQPGDTSGEGVGGVWYVARPFPITVGSTDAGTVLVATTSMADVDDTGAKDPSDRRRRQYSLYVFDNDANDASNDGINDSDCNDNCAVAWPPLFADAGATEKGQYSIIDREDGSKQWAFKGEPLYFFSGDSAIGQVNGDQVNGVWHLARPAPVQLFSEVDFGEIFAARGLIYDVDADGNRAETLSNKTDFTLYVFDDDLNDSEGDGIGDSDCNGNCAVSWPPLYANANDIARGDFSIIEREDGSRQWRYKGSPLYFFAGDTGPQQTNGVYGTWHEVSP